MKRRFLFLLLLFVVLMAHSQDKLKSIYSGGMLFYQPGYALTSNRHQTIRNASSALGGILRLYFGPNLTAGIYGGSLKTTYVSSGSDNSYLSLGYGGPFFGYSRKTGKIRYTASAFAGMGSVRNLHIESQQDNVLTDAYLYKHPAIVVSPILSFDYALTQKIALTMQAVWLTAAFDGNKTLINPTLQVGILFSR